MWTIIKFDRKKLHLLKKDLEKKLGSELVIYCPKFLNQKYKKNKLVNTEFNLLGDYLFCYHNKFKDKIFLNQIKFTIGLKYFLNGFLEFQNEIQQFINKCKSFENDKGFLSQNFFEIKENFNYKFLSGPFADKIFQILKFKDKKISILMGGLKTTLDKNKYNFSPL